MVEALPANRADDTFGISVLPWGTRSAENFLDGHRLDLLAEFLSVNAVSIPQQVLWSTVEWKCLDDLLRSPCGGGMGRDVRVQDAARADLHDHEDIEHATPERPLDSEVACEQRAAVAPARDVQVQTGD